jgi:hypothetical protein
VIDLAAGDTTVGSTPSDDDLVFVACKAIERAFPLDKVSDKFALFLLNVDGPKHDISKLPWRIRKSGDIEKFSCKKGSYMPLSKFPYKFRVEFSTYNSISLKARNFVIRRGYQGLQVLLTVDIEK